MGGFGSIPVDQQRTDRQERDLRTIAEDGSTPHPRAMDTQVPSKKDKKACQSAATEGQRKTPPEQMPGFAYVNWVVGKIAAAAAAAAKPKGKRRRYDNDDKMGEWVREWDRIKNLPNPPSKTAFAKSKGLPPDTFQKYAHNDPAKRRKLGGGPGRKIAPVEKSSILLSTNPTNTMEAQAQTLHSYNLRRRALVCPNVGQRSHAIKQIKPDYHGRVAKSFNIKNFIQDHEDKEVMEDCVEMIFDDLFLHASHHPAHKGKGISLSADSPYNNPPTVSTHRRSYFRNNFGKDGDMPVHDSNTVLRATYGTGSGIQTHGTPVG